MNPRDQRQLEVVQAAATSVISRMEILKGFGLEHYVRTVLPHNMDAMVVKLFVLFAADKIQNVTVRSPADWWEAVKERFAPKWFLRRYPVRYSITTVDIKAIWAGYRPPDGAGKWGPFLPYSLTRYNPGEDEL